VKGILLVRVAISVMRIQLHNKEAHNHVFIYTIHPLIRSCIH
jgi:hypothetical protein